MEGAEQYIEFPMKEEGKVMDYFEELHEIVLNSKTYKDALHQARVQMEEDFSTVGIWADDEDGNLASFTEEEYFILFYNSVINGLNGY